MHLALCTRLYALGSMHSALCTRLYALGSMHSALRTRLYALGCMGSMHFALCTWLYALGSMHSALCTRFYALGSMHSALRTRLYALGSMHLALCTWLYALGSMHSALCTRLCALGSMHGSMHLAPCTWLHVFDSAQVTLCKLVRELRAEEPFAMLSGKKQMERRRRKKSGKRLFPLKSQPHLYREKRPKTRAPKTPRKNASESLLLLRRPRLRLGFGPRRVQLRLRVLLRLLSEEGSEGGDLPLAAVFGATHVRVSDGFLKGRDPPKKNKKKLSLWFPLQPKRFGFLKRNEEHFLGCPFKINQKVWGRPLSEGYVNP